MLDSLTPATRLPQPDPDQAQAVAHAEGRVTLELLRTLGDDDWTRPTDCTDWDVRALVAHLVAQCQDGLHLGSVLRRELLGRRRYPDKSPLDGYMAVGVDDHRAASGPQLVERFASLWPRAARARRRRPAALRRITARPGHPRPAPLAPGLPAGRHLQPRPVDAPSRPGRDRAAVRPG
jgi:uncharacterized protein (TIGR03083 family)